MPLIDLTDVSKVYQLGKTLVQALNGISLGIETAEFTAIWGPSGSGKTTLLNLIGIIDDPTSGKIFLKGQDISTLTDNQKSEIRNRTIGFVFQTFNLIPVLSALENVMLPLQIQGVPSAEARRSAMARLEQVGLSESYRHRPDKLSGGQQQRVSIARALVTRPSLIIADEPTANLDSETALSIVEQMKELNREEKTTFLFSTHDDRLLKKVGRRINLIDGRVYSEP